MIEHYDYLIIGAGLYGLTCSRILSNNGFSCLVIDKRNHIGGNCYTRQLNGVEIHEYGAHVFHTSDEEVWSFVNRYSKMRQYTLQVCSTDGKGVYALPFNMFTFSSLSRKTSPNEVWNMLSDSNSECNTIEDVAINSVGKEVYEKLIKGYTEKQWGKSCSELPSSIIRRLPVRYSYDNNYFDDKYQGLPECGYMTLFEHMVSGISFDGRNIEAPIDIRLNTDFLSDMSYWLGKATNVIYCGSVDELFGYELGKLSWRSLRFEHSEYDYNGHNGQGCPLLNNSDSTVPYTRSIDHVYFGDYKNYRGKTILTHEYPARWDGSNERYYPNGSDELYEKYVKLLHERMPNVHLGGRIGLYRYMDMDDTIRSAMDWCSDKKKEVCSWEHYNEISKFCKIWVIGTNPGDVRLDRNLYYNAFITNDTPSRQNINKFNRFFSEFVAMWYVWKNHLYSRYVGFCHYRRMIDISDIKFDCIEGNIQHFHLNYLPFDFCDHYFDRTADYQFMSRRCMVPIPQSVIDDVLEYLSVQTTIPQDSLKEYCNPPYGSGMNYYNREIYCCEWNTFCNLMEFVNGYIEFISNKYALTSYDDWVKHMSKNIISFYKKKGREYVNGKKDYSLGLVFQTKDEYLRIFDKDEGLGRKCNNWRIYSYIIEDLISIYIGSNPHISSDKLGR